MKKLRTSKLKLSAETVLNLEMEQPQGGFITTTTTRGSLPECTNFISCFPTNCQ